MLVEFLAGSEVPFTCFCSECHDFPFFFDILRLVSRSAFDHMVLLLGLEDENYRYRGTAGQ